MSGFPQTAVTSSVVALWLLAIFFAYDFGFSSTPLTTQAPSLLPDSLVYSLGKYDAYANPRAKPRLADFPLLEAHIALNWTSPLGSGGQPTRTRTDVSPRACWTRLDASVTVIGTR
jgi:hypothetical protein